MQFLRRILHAILTAVMIVAAVWVWGVRASADQASTWSWQGTEGDAGFVAHVHAGDCSLFNPSDALGSGEATPEPGSGDTAFSFEIELDVPMPVLAETPHAVTIESLSSDVAAPQACGAIVGTASDGRLVTGIRTLEAGALEGLAILEPAGEESTHVMVFLVLSDEADQPSEDVEDDDGDMDEPDDDDGAEPEGGL